MAYTIEPRNAYVVEISLTSHDGPGLPREAPSFAYEAVTWTRPDGRTSATDDWLTPA